MVDIGLYVGYGLFLAALATAVVLPLIQVAGSPRVLTRVAIAFAMFVLLFVVSYLFSGSEVKDEYIARGVGEQSSKLIGSGLIMFYIVFAGALLAILFSQISKLFKR